MKIRRFGRAALAGLAVLIAASCSRPADELALLAVPGPKESLSSVVRRTHLLWKTSPRDSRGAAVLTFVAGLGERLDATSWWTVSGPVLHAWKQHRHNAALRDTLLKVNDVILSGLCDARDVEGLSQVIRVANGGPFDAPSINALLGAVVSDPLPDKGFDGSRQEAVLAASLAAQDPRRTREYLSRIARSATGSEAGLEQFKTVITLCLPEAAVQNFESARIIAEWRRSGSTALGRTVFQPALERSLLAQVLVGEPEGLRERIRRLLQDGAIGDAADFWETLLARNTSRPANLGADLPELLGSAWLVREYARRSGREDLESAFWKAPQHRNIEDGYRAAHRYLEFAAEALRVEEFELARISLERANSLTVAGADPALDLRLTSFSATLDSAKKQSERVEQARSILSRVPDSAPAALMLGRHLCLGLGKWEEGLPLLARGTDLGLKVNAVKDLQNPSTWGEQLSVGDLWSDSFKYVVRPPNDRLLERAALWYTKALDSAPASERSVIERRLAGLPPSAAPLDLLPRVDPKVHSVYGAWTRRDGGLLSDASDFARFEIPYHPPAEYDVRITFTRMDGLGDLVFFLTRDSKPFAWVLSGSGPDARGWASVRNQWDADGNPTRVYTPGWMESGRVSTCVVEVRRSSLRVLLDGKLILDRPTTFEEMELPEWLRLRDPAKLGVGTYRSPTLIRRVQLTEIGARGRPAP